MLASPPNRTLAINLLLPRADFNVQVDCHLPLQGVSVILGESGSGKTSLLRGMAGLIRGVGRVAFGEEIWQDTGAAKWTPVWQRPLGLVFQDSSLLATMTVRENLDFATTQGQQRAARRAVSSQPAFLDDGQDHLGIAALMSRSVTSLSGGERQRVAIACALMSAPELLLLDEPLSAVDERHRRALLPWLIRLRRMLTIPMVMVTHSWEEATQMADHLLLMEAGKIKSSTAIEHWMPNLNDDTAWQQWLQWPAAWRDVAGVVVEGRVAEHDPLWHLTRLAVSGGDLWVRADEVRLGTPIRLRILARDVSLSRSPLPETSTIQNHLAATITAIRDDVHPAYAWVQLQSVSSTHTTPPAPPLRFFAKVTRRAVHQLSLTDGLNVWANLKAVALLD